MKSLKALASLTAVAALALSACSSSSSGSNSSSETSSETSSNSGSSSNSDTGSNSNSDSGSKTKIVIGASPVPHAKILDYVKSELAEEAGIEIEVKTYQDYVQPNVALKNGDIDANFFQHIPYLEEETEAKGYQFDHGDGVHIEPYGIYSTKIEDLKDLSEGASIAVTDDPSNQERALKLLEANDLITLPEDETATIHNIEDNPKNLKIKAVAPPSIPSVLPDYDAGIINGNVALENGLVPSKDAIYLESGEDNPYANVLVWGSDLEGDKLEAVKKLDELLHSEEVADYIRQTWPDGEVIPAF